VCQVHPPRSERRRHKIRPTGRLLAALTKVICGSRDVQRSRPSLTPKCHSGWCRGQYDPTVAQCLLITPSYADLSALRTVLTELDITPTATTQLLVGAQLATVPLEEFSFAVAVLPSSKPGGAPTTAATIFLEAGIALGRGLPLIFLIEDPNDDLPALGGVASDVWTITGAKDEASIRLHLTLFVKILGIRRPAGGSEPFLEPSQALPATPSTVVIGQRH